MKLINAQRQAHFLGENLPSSPGDRPSTVATIDQILEVVVRKNDMSDGTSSYYNRDNAAVLPLISN
jgi:hypothetical protein